MRYTAYFRGAGYFSAKGWEREAPRYNSNYSTRLMGGVEWEPPRYNSKLGYNSSFLRFGVCVGERVMLRVVPPTIPRGIIWATILIMVRG